MTRFDSTLSEIAKHDHRRTKFTFSSIQELLYFLDRYDTSDCFFRGQTNRKNEIISTLHRNYSIDGFKKKVTMASTAVNWLLKNEYIQEALKNNIDYAIAIAQHYGCPTDFVDITSNYKTAAFFALSNDEKHKKTPEGCVWVFPRSEIERMQNMTRDSQDYYFWSLRKKLSASGHITELIAKDYKQLIEIDLPQLSRLNAQDGAFLWDFHGILNYQLKYGEIGTHLVFKHAIGEEKILAKDKKRLSPTPNPLESEIRRIFTKRKNDKKIAENLEKHQMKKEKDEEKISEFAGPIEYVIAEKEGALIDGLLPKFVDNSIKMDGFPLPDFFSPTFCEYPWTKRTLPQTGVYDTCEKLEYTIPTTLTNYLYSSDEIEYVKSTAEKIKNFLEQKFHGSDEIEYVKSKVLEQKFCDNEKETQYIRDLSLILGHVEDWLSEYYKCRITKLHIHDTNGFARFWLPENYTFLDNTCQSEFDRFDKSVYNIPKMLKSCFEELPDNSKIFIYQHKPHKILPYENLKKMFIDLILPQLFAIRGLQEKEKIDKERKYEDMIFIPDYVTEISFPFFNRPLYMDTKTNIADIGGFIVV